MFVEGKEEKGNKLILCVDFDGVVHSYTSGWQGETVIPDPPVPGAFNSLKEYTVFFSVNIYSTRSSSFEGIDAMKEWFLRNGWPSNKEKQPENLFFPMQKPPAFVSIDDRAITFEGHFPSVEYLQNFKPWNKTPSFFSGVKKDFQAELTYLINRYSKESLSNTPDFILAQFLVSCLDSFNLAIVTRSNWFSDDKSPFFGAFFKGGRIPRIPTDPVQRANFDPAPAPVLYRKEEEEEEKKND